ncbi:type II secretion system protein GspC [Vibrio cortegadensis]|uniref:Type II secretion system protein GspC n=1 Tax=Vibrio cortegadensis TaxID=1328770 RepID=A0ABV4M7B8_9VIBR
MKRLELGSGINSSPLYMRLLNNGPALQQQISFVLTLVLIAASAWILGQIIWFVQPQSGALVPWKAQVSQNRGNHQSQQMDLSDLQSINLFGAYDEKRPQVIAKPVVQDAPKTRLNLVLVGAVASSNPNTSLAVIANRGKQATYGINEEIEGTRAKLKAVLIDRVIIDNSGRDETLMLEGLEYKKLSVSEPSNKKTVSNVRGNNPSSARDKLAKIKQTITRDPQQIFQYVRLSQVKQGGKVRGYRVSPGKEPELFQSVGLQSGDIATQLNGLDLTDPKAMGQIFRSISDLTELSLTVERGGQQHDIYIEF